MPTLISVGQRRQSGVIIGILTVLQILTFLCWTLSSALHCDLSTDLRGRWAHCVSPFCWIHGKQRKGVAARVFSQASPKHLPFHSLLNKRLMSFEVSNFSVWWLKNTGAEAEGRLSYRMNSSSPSPLTGQDPPGSYLKYIGWDWEQQ